MARYSELHVFYNSDAWKKLRLALILERGSICQECGKHIVRSIDIIGHHIIPLTLDNYIDPNISLNPNNIKIVCFDCHNKIENRFGHEATKQVSLIYGAPLSGKTTLVKQLMHSGDIIVDINEIYRSISGLDLFEKPDNLFANAMAVQNLMIENIRTRYGKWRNAWIIGGYPEPFTRNKLVDGLGAELIFCDASRDECVTRIYKDDDRKMKPKEWTMWIDKWFEQYKVG